MDTPSLPFDPDDSSDDEESPEHDRLWGLLRRLDRRRGASFDVDAEWNRLADRLDLDADLASPSQNRRAPDRAARPVEASRPRRRWARMLTAALLVVGLAGIGAWWWQQPVSVTTAAGGQTTVSLPDGSTVELNGASTLTYSRSLSSLVGEDASARRVTFDGEGFFSVVDRDRPFRVETPNARVEVLGTSFTVRTQTQRDESETAVAVASGRVRVAASNRDRADGEASEVLLDEPGEASRVIGTNAPSAPRSIDLKYVQAWRNGGFAIAEADLPTVLRELERRFGTSLQLAVPVPQTDTMTLHYAQDAQLKNVLRDICLIQDLSYHRTSQGYKLVSDAE